MRITRKRRKRKSRRKKAGAPLRIPPFLNWTQTFYEGEQDGNFSAYHRGQPPRHKRPNIGDKSRKFLLRTNKLREEENIDPSRKYLSPADVEIISRIREKIRLDKKIIEEGRKAVKQYGNLNNQNLGISPLYIPKKSKSKTKKL